MKTVIVLGFGNIGAIVASELAKEYDVHVITQPVDTSFFYPGIKTIRYIPQSLMDMGEIFLFEEAKSLKASLIVNTLPASCGEWVLSHIPNAIDYIDVSYMDFSPEKSFLEACHKGGRILLDAGFAPGLTNLLVGRAGTTSKKVKGTLYAGGFAEDEDAPMNGYATTWCPEDLIDEYKRPARYLKKGKIVEAPALSECEPVFDGSPHEAFLTDGLRSLLHYPKAHSLKEKTVRWKGYVDLVKSLSAEELERELQNCVGVEDMVYFLAELNDKEAWFKLYAKDGMTAMQRATALSLLAFCKLYLENKDMPNFGYPEYVGEHEEAYKFVVDVLDGYGIELRLT